MTNEKLLIATVYLKRSEDFYGTVRRISKRYKISILSATLIVEQAKISLFGTVF